MPRNLKRILITATVLVAAGVGGTAAVQAGSGDDDVTTGPQAERAGAAAVKIAGGGTVASVERDAEGDRVWEVEVTQADGTAREVDLNAALQRVAAERDDSDSGEPDDADDADDAKDDDANDDD